MNFRLTLPEPPSANRYWRHVGRNVVLSEQARMYRDRVATQCFLQTQMMRPYIPRDLVGIRLTWYRGRKAGDLDNRLKQLLDALKGVAYRDDSQVVEIHATRADDKNNARVELELYTVSPSPSSPSGA